MTTLSRKQREIIERESKILEVAQSMLHELGYAHLTMDKIAEATEYSKGTIYNHFSSKEDLICAISCQCMNRLTDLFETAAHYPGQPRERFLALGLAYTLYHRQNPLELQHMQIVKNYAVREKISSSRKSEIDTLEERLINTAISIVNEAIDNGSIDARHHSSAKDIVFGAWALIYGSLLLEQSDVPLKDLGFQPVMDMTWGNMQAFIDGYGWQPLSSEYDDHALLDRLINVLSKSSHLQTTSTYRET